MILSVGRTDIGRVRDANEDAFLAAPTILAVADGMGGHDAGALAAKTAIEAVRQHIKPGSRQPAREIGRAFARANRTIRKIGAREGHKHMGTTLTVATIHGDMAWIGHAGDSRAYLFRDNRLIQLTADHSLVAELVRRGQLTPDDARKHPKRNIITRAVGSDRQIKPDIFSHDLQPGDRLLLCTDGLTGPIDDSRLFDLGSSRFPGDRTADKLIKAANEAGGDDNITVVIGDVEQAEPLPGRSRAPLYALLIIVLALVVFAGISWRLNHLYYLTASSGRVTVNRGLPVEPFGLNLGRFDYRTSVRVKDLPDYYVARLKQEMVVGDKKRLDTILTDIKDLARRNR